MKLNTIAKKLAQAFSVAALVSFSGPSFAAMDDAAIEAYLKKQGCFKCHAPDKEKKGPSLKKIAAKHKGKADGEAKMIKNFTTSPKVKLDDGTEEEHKMLESKDAAEHKAIANWILNR